MNTHTPGPVFDKAWQRRNYHAQHVENVERSVRSTKQYSELKRHRRMREAELHAMIVRVEMRKARKRSVMVSYPEAARILGVETAMVGRLLFSGTIHGDRKKKVLSLSSLEAYRDTRYAA